MWTQVLPCVCVPHCLHGMLHVVAQFTLHEQVHLPDAAGLF